MDAGTPIATSTLLERIAALQSEEQIVVESSGALQCLIKYASVQSCFSAHPLFAQAGVAFSVPLFDALTANCQRVDGIHDGEKLWRLELGARRGALRQIGTLQEMHLLRKRVQPGRDDAIQRMLDAVLLGNLPSESSLSLDEIAALLIVNQWLDGIVDTLPSSDSLHARLAMERLLQPMRRLVGDHFVGRQSELSQLADYVGVLPPDKILGLHFPGKVRRFARQVWHDLRERPPLYISGPGGVGKSSLLARFILDHVRTDTAEHLPFVLLDFDRAQVDATEPLTLLISALNQLQVQYPKYAETMAQIAKRIGEQISGRDEAENIKADSLQTDIIVQYATFLESMLGGDDNPTPLLWVLDTFEEPQRRGVSVVGSLWELMNQLQKYLPRLRLVVSGRVVPAQFQWKTINLLDFDAESARAFLLQRMRAITHNVTPQAKVLDRIVSAVGRTPLALSMAVRVIANEGPQALKSLISGRPLFFSMRSEQIQAQLFHRILEHIRVATPNLPDKDLQNLTADLRKIAYPGLAVRRLTPEVIREVLAQPCGLERCNYDYAVKLFNAMQSQVDIVEVDIEDGALLHRTDVRQLMLRDLEQVGGTKLHEIDRRAIRHYAARESLRDRAEELYHRLRLSQTAATIDKRWLPGVEKYLLSALDEIDDRRRVYLAERLGITLSAEALASAAQDDWERQTQRRMQQYINAGNPEKALSLLNERTMRRPASQLHRLEAEALILLRNNGYAGEVAERGLDEALAMGDLTLAIDLTLLLSSINESRLTLEEALQHAQKAHEWALRQNDAIAQLRARVAMLRLLRKLHADDATQEAARAAVLALLDTDTLRKLRGRPALQRELLGELGADDVKILRMGVEILGISLADEQTLGLVAQILAGWASRTGGAEVEFSRVTDAFGVSAGKQKSLDTSDWFDWLRRHSARDVGHLVGELLRRAPPGPSVLAMIAQIYRQDTDRRITRTSGSKLI